MSLPPTKHHDTGVVRVTYVSPPRAAAEVLSGRPKQWLTSGLTDDALKRMRGCRIRVGRWRLPLNSLPMRLRSERREERREGGREANGEKGGEKRGEKGGEKGGASG